MTTTQWSLDELATGLQHGHAGVTATDDGYRGRCLCGWVSVVRPKKPQARGSVSGHLSRTIQGQLLLKTLRKH